MRLRAIRLHNVRRFTARGIAIDGIGDGVNVLAEPNEHGKSTVFDALHALFFQSHKTKPKPVQQLQPYSKGPVTVEADIDLPEGGFRLRKRWFGSVMAEVRDIASNRVLAQADEAERWIAERLSGGATGPAGLLWVQQGVVEMGQGGKKSADEEQAAREDVLTSVSGEIETLTGGKRTAQVLSQCSQALDAYVTATGRPKTGGPFAEAIAGLETLEAAVAEKSELVAALRADLDTRASARHQLAELNDPERRARDTAAVAEAEAALATAQDHIGRLETATLVETLAKQERDAAEQGLIRFDIALARGEVLKKQVAREEADHAAADSARRAAEQQATDAAASVQTCRADLQKADDALNAARKAALARAAAEQLKGLEKTLSDAEGARRDAEAAGAAARALALPKSQVDALAKIDDTIAALTIEHRASSVSLRVEYLDPDGTGFRRGSETLPHEADLSIDAVTRIDVDGTGSLTVSPGSAQRQDTALALHQAADKRAGLLSELGIESLAVARERQAASDEKSRLAGQHTARLGALAPDGLDALRAEVARRRAAIGEQMDPSEPLDVLTARRDAAETARGTAEAANESAQAGLAECDRALVRVQTALQRSRETLAEQTALSGAPDDETDQRAALSAALSAKVAAHETAHRDADALRAKSPDLDTLRGARTRAVSIVERTRAEAEALEKTISTLDGSIGARANAAIEEDLAETIGRRDRAAERVDDLKAEVATLVRLRDVLTTAKAAAKDHFFEPVVKELKPLLEIVFGDASVTFDERTLLPVSLERGGAVEDFAVLSGGMREQITILTRLAFARLLAQDGRTVPVILDDALIYSDDDRIERMFDALHRQAMDLQILVFTCRQRAFQRLGGQALSMAAWQPETHLSQ